MKIPDLHINKELLSALKAKYFNDGNKSLSLAKGSFLFKQNEINNRLYLVTKGTVAGYLISDSGIKHEVFRSTQDMFVGVHSFFAGTHKAYASVIALENCHISYIEYEDLNKFAGDSYHSDFLPIIVHELSARQRFSKDIMLEKEYALKKLHHSEKMSTLGQMAAGLAHELNNAIGVMKGNSVWIANEVQNYLKTTVKNDVFLDFENGFEAGQIISSEDVRGNKKHIEKKFNLPTFIAKRLAKLNYGDDKIKQIANLDNLDKVTEKKQQVWELGVALHDMIFASKHAVHVLKSIKQLSKADQERIDLNINDTLKEAFILLKNVLLDINVDLQLGEIPEIQANNGELIQVWVNIIKNACESMINAKTENPSLLIRTKHTKNNIAIEISDNGPGIPKNLQDNIFQPNFTTKKGGLSFGLGLGLSIVQRLIDSYNGKINVVSKPGNTKFTIQIPAK